MVIAGSDKTTRRRGMRRQRDPSPSSFGPDLRDTREHLELSLESVQDRTGVRRRHLEALEEGDLSGFPDERTALVAVRRYAEILGLDAAAMVQKVEDQWRIVTTPAPAPAPSPAPSPIIRATPVENTASTSVPAAGGHLSRYPGDSSHLRAFTQTAQVPQVASRTISHTLPPGLRFDTTDAIPVTWRDHPGPPPAPLALRVAVWTTVLLLVLGLAGLAVHHWKPAWLAKVHLVAGAGAKAGAKNPGSTAPTTPIVTETDPTPTSAVVTVRSPGFQVVVATQATCWIHVTTPASATPVFSSTVPPGTSKVFTSVNGQLTVELGASHALVAVQILGKTVPGWALAPKAVPYTVTFRSSTT